MEWISVKDRLPDDDKNTNYLVYDNYMYEWGVSVSVASYSNGEWYDYLGEIHKYSEHITHWAILPEPPKK